MVKRILIFALTFAIALGGATALVVARTKPVPSAPKAAIADTAVVPRDSSASHDSVAATDSAKIAQDTTTPARAAAMPAKPLPVAPRDSAKPLPVVPAGIPVVGAASPAGPVTPLLAGGRLSKIFGAMSPRDAAKVLEQMDDADVKQILARLNDKKAAEILALLPAARAALISKAALTNPGTIK
jgi:hypothetical protein